MHDKGNECCCQPMLEEFHRDNFSLHYGEPAVFCRSQWQQSERNFIWLTYRWLWAVFFLGGVIGSLIQHFNEGTWFIYLTDWGFVLCAYACTYSAILATIYYLWPGYFGELVIICFQIMIMIMFVSNSLTHNIQTSINLIK